MSAQFNSSCPDADTALRGTEGTFAVGGLTCSVSRWSFSGTRESDFLAPRHHLASVRELQRGDHLVMHGSFGGKRHVARTLCEHDSFFLPKGQRWVGKATGNAEARILTCELEPSVLTHLFGDRAADFDLEPYFGACPIAPGLLERLEALCIAPDAFPRAYGDALTVALACELFRACSSKPFPPPPNANVGAKRFRQVLEHIEGSLETDTSLSDLASLTGLSVSHFSHAFTAAQGVAPHRYILQRRIDKAKALLRNSDATVASISARVGFSSQSRFTQVFARQTGITPSAYRSEQMR